MIQSLWALRVIVCDKNQIKIKLEFHILSIYGGVRGRGQNLKQTKLNNLQLSEPQHRQLAIS